MPLTDWDKAERPREKLLAKGAGALSDAELLAIFLRTGVPGKNVVEMARDLLQHFNDIRGLLSANQKDFCQYPGLGKVKFVQLQAVLEMARRHFSQTLSRTKVLSDPAATRDYLVAQLRDYQHEVFACLFLDNRHRIIQFKKLFHGTIDCTNVYPREVVKQALALNTAAVIFAHNHPSGVAKPSQADIQLTQRLKQALELVDIRVLDHFVIGDGEPISFAEQGLL